MNTDLKRTCDRVYESVAETFGAMVFAQVLRSDSPGYEFWNVKPFWTSIEIQRPVEAKMTLLVPGDLAAVITRGLYGLTGEETLSNAMITDAMAELINTISGQLMSKITPTNQTFGLGLPEFNEDWLHETEDIAECYFKVDELTFKLIIKGDINHE